MSDFSTEGFAPMPNIYADNQEVRNFSAWGRGRLEQRVSEYGLFLQSPDLMPRARQGANRVMDHALFELAWQDGVYDQNITIQEE